MPARIFRLRLRAMMEFLSSVFLWVKALHVIAVIAFMAGMPAGARAILTRFEIDYLKKARGTLFSECQAPVPATDESREFEVECALKDESGATVCRPATIRRPCCSTSACWRRAGTRRRRRRCAC